MRGKREFKKLITRMPSGRFAWNIFDRMGNRFDGGLARTYREARKKAQASEISGMNSLPPPDNFPKHTVNRGRTCLGRFMPLPNESNHLT